MDNAMIKILNSETEIRSSELEISIFERKGRGTALRKRGLKDVKRRNRQVIVEAVLENSGLSRVEIAQKTELAPSTVSSLVSELIGEGILKEGGTVITAGRSRTELTVNPEYGSIAVIEIGRKETCITCFDMLLQPTRRASLSSRYVAGNELLSLIVHCINTLQEELPPLAGIGLLFQEDMRESDFRVMYSTGFSSASITLKDALMTQYKVPIEEEYSVSYTVTNALAQEADLDARNSAHISVGSRVLASVTLEGREVPVRSNFCEELAVAMDQQENSSEGNSGRNIVTYLANLIAMLCMLFPLETVFLSGTALPEEAAAEDLRQLAGRKVPNGQMPQLKFLRPGLPKDGNLVMARQVLRKVLVVR